MPYANGFQRALQTSTSPPPAAEAPPTTTTCAARSRRRARRASPTSPAAAGSCCGKLLRFYLDAAYEVPGVDVSSDQVALARKATPKVGEAILYDHLAGQIRSSAIIPGPDAVEHFLKDEVSFLDLCHAALMQGRRRALQSPNAESSWRIHHRYNNLIHELGFNPNALLRLLPLVGLEGIEVHEKGPVPWGYSPASALRWCEWQCIRAGLNAFDIADTRDAGSRVFTRLFALAGHCRKH